MYSLLKKLIEIKPIQLFNNVHWGRNQKSLDDYKDRFKIDYAGWMQGKRTGATLSRQNDGRGLALFNAARGDQYYDYYLTDTDRKALGLYKDKATLQ